jgi:hypothetical protein
VAMRRKPQGNVRGYVGALWEGEGGYVSLDQHSPSPLSPHRHIPLSYCCLFSCTSVFIVIVIISLSFLTIAASSSSSWVGERRRRGEIHYRRLVPQFPTYAPTHRARKATSRPNKRKNLLFFFFSGSDGQVDDLRSSTLGNALNSTETYDTRMFDEMDDESSFFFMLLLRVGEG